MTKRYGFAFLYLVCLVFILSVLPSQNGQTEQNIPDTAGANIIQTAVPETVADNAVQTEAVTDSTRQTAAPDSGIENTLRTEAVAESAVHLPVTGSEVQEADHFRDGLRLIAHRGYAAAAPENTLAAFEQAVLMGYDCIETDLRFTSDGYAVLLHHPVVDYTSNSTGNIASMTFEQVRALDFGVNCAEKYAGTTIPTLREALDFCRERGLHVYLELKVPEMTPEQYRQTAQTIRECGMREHVTMISFYLACLQGMAAQDTGYGFRLLTSSHNIKERHDSNDAPVQEAMEYFWSIQETAQSVGISWNYARLTPELAQAVADAGLTLEAWTVNTLEEVQDLPRTCRAITTDAITYKTLSDASSAVTPETQ